MWKYTIIPGNATAGGTVGTLTVINLQLVNPNWISIRLIHVSGYLINGSTYKPFPSCSISISNPAGISFPDYLTDNSSNSVGSTQTLTWYTTDNNPLWPLHAVFNPSIQFGLSLQGIGGFVLNDQLVVSLGIFWQFSQVFDGSLQGDWEP